ncbi:MAG: polysaccharide pyruvyl transferase family protein [Planctomycetia bacterium]|nr:polysaccharide pyruvyl transferase family protein [Planctomycetia bacterium]
MNRIALLTFTNSDNYGALLQAYALQEKLSQLGYDSTFLDYRRPFRPKSMLRRLKYFLVKRLLTRFFQTKRQRSMERFRRQYFQRTKPLQSRSEMIKMAAEFQIFIVGSDQVWNIPKLFDDDTFLLPFVSDQQRRISYAPSFYFSTFPEDYISLYKRELEKFDFLSVRELEGQQYVRDLIGREATLVLDPTLLLTQNDWDKIAIPYQSKDPYIFCYFIPEGFGQKPILTNRIIEFARKISERNHWKIVCCGNKSKAAVFPAQTENDVGPLEFLGFFQNASFVLTNSFHGTSFAVNYKRPFYSFLDGKYSLIEKAKSRIGTLLGLLGLESRFLSTKEDFPEPSEWDISFDEAELRLDKERIQSLDFLKTAIK